MGKIVAIMMLVLMFVTPAFAEALDLHAMTTDELLALRNQINGILAERMASDADAIYKGRYTVGKDIKAGRYVLLFDRIADGCTYGELTIYQNQKARDNGKCTIEYLLPNVECYLDLSDGMIIEINYASGTLTGISAASWTP